jgi:hypothetical protein
MIYQISEGPAGGLVDGKRAFSLARRPENAAAAVTHTNLALRYLRYHHLSPW